MEILSQLNTWERLFSLALLLLAIYWFFKLFTYAIEKFAKQNLYNKKVNTTLKKGLLLFKPTAILLLILDFVSINYITHTILLAVVCVFGFSHLKNYINGLILKLNPLINKGALIKIDNYIGEIKTMLPFGLILNTENGERFINYSFIEKKGFAIKFSDTSLLRQTLYLETKKTEDEILDLLFDNPILNYEDNPVLKASENNKLKLQYTLETGASTEALIAFLEDNKIIASLTNTIQS